MVGNERDVQRKREPLPRKNEQDVEEEMQEVFRQYLERQK
jgi:hypothetical protein